MSGWSWALWLLAFACGAPLLVWAVECASALILPKPSKREGRGRRASVTVLVPAHNEAGGIQRTLESLAAQLVPGDALIVIADNCTDDTAEIARRCRATVIERSDPERRGKSYALDFGVRSLGDRASDVVIVVDADCTAQADAITLLAETAVRTGRPVQASYYMEQPSGSRPQNQLAALAFFIKNVVRPAGLARLGFPCLLNGTGMAFPPGVVRSIDWANRGLADDYWSTVEMALAGHVPVFCEDSRILSRLPDQASAFDTQRTRWIHGHLESMLLQGPRLIAGAIRQRRPELLAVAVDLLVPPFSLLILLWLAGLAVTIPAGVLGAGLAPALFLAACGFLTGILFAAMAWRFGNGGVGSVLTAAPRYILTRLRVILKFPFGRPKRWIPTARGLQPSGERDPAILSSDRKVRALSSRQNRR